LRIRMSVFSSVPWIAVSTVAFLMRTSLRVCALAARLNSKTIIRLVKVFITIQKSGTLASRSTDWTAGILACVSVASTRKTVTCIRRLTPRKPRRCRQGCLRSSRIRHSPSRSSRIPSSRKRDVSLRRVDRSADVVTGHGSLHEDLDLRPTKLDRRRKTDNQTCEGPGNG